MKPTDRKSFVLAGLGAAAAAALPRGARAQTAPALTTLRLGTAPGDDATPVVYGQKAGIFAKYGLDLQIGKITGPAAAALLGGTFDLGKSNITGLFQAHENGLALTLVAAASIENLRVPYVGFMMQKDSPIRTGKDFNNQLVGVAALQDIGWVALSKWVDEHGGDYKSIKFVEIPTGAAPVAVAQGRVVASESTYPAIGAGLDTGKLRLFTPFDTLGSGTVLTAWAATTDFSAKHPDLIRAFVRGWREAATYTNAHHSETVAVMAEFTGIEASIIAAMPRATAGPTVSAGQVQPLIDAAAKYGALKQSFPAADLLDPNLR
jgi:ABC-type nitrate/sulfonate/bicarbonate transport system substrate-binding protein